MILVVNLFTPLWVLWGVMFVGIEATALWAAHSKRAQDGTLSALVKRATSWKDHPAVRILILTGWAVLTTHFFFGWP